MAAYTHYAMDKANCSPLQKVANDWIQEDYKTPRDKSINTTKQNTVLHAPQS